MKKNKIKVTFEHLLCIRHTRLSHTNIRELLVIFLDVYFTPKLNNFRKKWKILGSAICKSEYFKYKVRRYL